MIIFSSHGCYKSTIIFYHDKYGAETGQSGATNIVKLPLAFVRSGWFNLDYYGYGHYSGIYSFGESGYNWSRTSRSSTLAHYLNIDPNIIPPSNNADRYFGFSLRFRYPGSV